MFEPVISVITLREIEDTPDRDRRVAMQQMVSAFPVLPFDEEAYALAQVYVQRGIFPEKYASDANHVAIAVVSGTGYFANWNFKHLVRVSTRREVNLLNALEGYGNIEIVAPPEM